MKFTKRCLLLTLGSALLLGCQNEVPQTDMPGGVLSGSDYQRKHAQHRGTMSPAMRDSIAKSRATPATRLTTAPADAPAAPATPSTDAPTTPSTDAPTDSTAPAPQP